MKNINEAEKIKIFLLKHIYKSDNSEDIVAVPEVAIFAKIIDILVVNGLVHIYEIKSKTDSLARLPNQIEIFKKYADKVTVVAHSKFIAKLKEISYMEDIGIIEVDDSYKLKHIKEPSELNILAENYFEYLTTCELRETLRGVCRKYYKMSFKEAQQQMIALLNNSKEIRKVGLHRIKEKYRAESSAIKEQIRDIDCQFAILSRYKTYYGTTYTTSLANIVSKNLLTETT